MASPTLSENENVTTATKTKARRLSQEATEQFVDEVFEGVVDLFVDNINGLCAEGEGMPEAMHKSTVLLAVALTRAIYEDGYDADRVCPYMATNMVIDRYFAAAQAASVAKARTSRKTKAR